MHCIPCSNFPSSVCIFLKTNSVLAWLRILQPLDIQWFWLRNETSEHPFWVFRVGWALMNAHHPMFYFSISYTTFLLQIPSFPTMTRDLLPCYSVDCLYSKEDSVAKGVVFFQSHLVLIPGGFLRDTFSSLKSSFANLHLMNGAGVFSFLQTMKERRKKKDAVSVFSWCPAEGGVFHPPKKKKKRHLNKALAKLVFGDYGLMPVLSPLHRHPQLCSTETVLTLKIPSCSAPTIKVGFSSHKEHVELLSSWQVCSWASSSRTSVPQARQAVSAVLASLAWEKCCPMAPDWVFGQGAWYTSFQQFTLLWVQFQISSLELLTACL